MRESSDVVLEVVEAIAEQEGVGMRDLEYVLHDHIDAEAIKRLASMDVRSWSLTFEVPDHQVTIDGHGRILVDGELVREVDLAGYRAG